MKVEKELENYLVKAMGKLVADILKSTIKNPKETAFLIKFREHLKTLKNRRKERDDCGEHIPGFLIASITNSCNLFCSGCYARANGMCNDDKKKELLSATDWCDIFTQSAALGIPFILLAGGEPLMRRDVITVAAEFKETVFPVFTNGTLIDDTYLTLFDKNRNIVPVLSVEGDEQCTDEKRGSGVYKKLDTAMSKLKDSKILFGASLTVTRQNINKITGDAFIKDLKNHGCRVVIFVEYVAVDGKSQSLAIDEAERQQLAEHQQRLRKDFPSVIFISFPGDEKQMGGCLAAGRGFFHISPEGNAEACPFSPYSDCNLKEVSLLEALESPFFQLLRQKHLVGGEHSGGCALFEREIEVKECLVEAEKGEPVKEKHDF